MDSRPMAPSVTQPVLSAPALRLLSNPGGHLLAPLPPKGIKREGVDGSPATPGALASSSSGSTSKRGAKVSLACASCQKAHTSCDAARPCGRCVKRGEGHLCVDAPRKAPRSTAASISASAASCSTCPLNSSQLRPLLPRPSSGSSGAPARCIALAPKPIGSAGESSGRNGMTCTASATTTPKSDLKGNMTPATAAALFAANQHQQQQTLQRSFSDPSLANLSLFSNASSPAMSFQSPLPKGSAFIPPSTTSMFLSSAPAAFVNMHDGFNAFSTLPGDDLPQFHTYQRLMDSFDVVTEKQTPPSVSFGGGVSFGTGDQSSQFMLPDDDLLPPPPQQLSGNHNQQQPIRTTTKIPPCHIPSLVDSGAGGFVYDNVDSSWLDMLLRPSVPSSTSAVDGSTTMNSNNLTAAGGGGASNFEFGLISWLAATPAVGVVSAPHQEQNHGSSNLMTDSEMNRMLEALSGSTTNFNSNGSGGVSGATVVPAAAAAAAATAPAGNVMAGQIAQTPAPPRKRAAPLRKRKVATCPVKSRVGLQKRVEVPGPGVAAAGTNVVTVDTFLTDLEHLLQPTPAASTTFESGNLNGTSSTSLGHQNNSDLKNFSSDDVTAWIDAWGKEIADESFGKSGCSVGCSDCPFHDSSLDW
ncbi:hypothetical protein BDR26DRAFT_858833 [Obelidium mucronatum]|nr:hypothetical protein BDR26DRAFT_858833 [Obelidium mucronatum]